jgi:hypothetical protein
MGRVELPVMPANLQHIAEGIAWSSFIAANLDRFQRTLDVPLGAELGCGRFGCVFASEEPWVIKITRDESEGPVWRYQQELLNKPDEGFEELPELLPAFLQVHDVVRVTPDVIFNGESQPVYGIVRESAAPIFTQVAVRNPFNDTPTYKMALSEETERKIGLSPVALKRVGLPSPVLYSSLSEAIARFHPGVQKKFSLLHQTLEATRRYRMAADRFGNLRWVPMRLKEGGGTKREQEAAAELADDALRDMAVAWRELQRNPLGAELGLTLETALNSADLAFRDLHAFNIGWRTHEVIDGVTRPMCMVILDPGAMATPVQPDIREVELLENAGRYLRNAGLIR